MVMEAGHVFLARLGKRRLRPGGRTATDWLMQSGKLSSRTEVLEVACNMGTTTAELVKKYGCHVTALDLDAQALAKARKNLAASCSAGRVSFVEGDATALPFPDGSFDVVINEAMLTMLNPESRAKAVAEYFRVLKRGGVLLTQDVMLTEESPELVQGLSRAINVRVYPLTEAGWRSVFEERGFTNLQVRHGPVTLMTLGGMIYDEGLWGALRVFLNGWRKQDRGFFRRMSGFFRTHRKQMDYIAVVSVRP